MSYSDFYHRWTAWHRVAIITLVVSAVVAVSSGIIGGVFLAATIIYGMFTIKYVVRNIAELLGPEPFASFKGTVWRFYIFATSAVTFAVVMVALLVVPFTDMSLGQIAITLLGTPAGGLLDASVLILPLTLSGVIAVSICPFATYLQIAPFVLIWRKLRPAKV